MSHSAQTDRFVHDRLPPPAQCAIVGEPEAAVGAWVPDNPPALIDYLHFHRAYKTPYELELMRRASRRATQMSIG